MIAPLWIPCSIVSQLATSSPRSASMFGTLAGDSETEVDHGTRGNFASCTPRDDLPNTGLRRRCRER